MLLEPDKFNVCPEHNGVFEAAAIVGAAVELIETVVVDVEKHPL